MVLREILKTLTKSLLIRLLLLFKITSDSIFKKIVYSYIGDRGSKFYIILEGKIGIFLKNKNELKKVKELEGGESFGELALVNDAPRSASIKCLLDCHFAVLDKKNYITLFQ